MGSAKKARQFMAAIYELVAMKWDYNFLRKAITRAATAFSSTPAASQLHFESQTVLRILDAMTAEERCNCDLLLDRDTLSRIARDANVTVADVGQLVAQRQAMVDVLKGMRHEE